MIVFFWILFAVVVGVWASKWDRIGILWFLLALAISPLLAALFLAVVGIKGKVCPKCADKVRRQAEICKHCGHAFAAAA